MLRRSFLAGSGGAAFLLGFHHSKPGLADGPAGEPFLQPETTSDDAFVERAFEMRRLAVDYGDQAYGAVVVRDGIIIGQSWSRVILDQDPTAHAELSAIRDAAHRLDDRDLSGAIMNSSSRPCPMCEAAAFWARIDRMVFGREATNGGAPSLCR